MGTRGLTGDTNITYGGNVHIFWYGKFDGREHLGDQDTDG